MKKASAAIFLSMLLLPLKSPAQSIPYSTVAAMQEAAESVATKDGILSFLRMTHTDEKDRRPFEVFLESPTGRTEMKVQADGSFHFPALPKDDWEHSMVVHSLERGALAISFGFGFVGPKPSEAENGVGVFEMCSMIVDGFRKLEGAREKLGHFMPELTNLRFAIVGLSFPRTKPVAGEVLLQQGGATVASIDLSETGAVSWFFDTYDPKEHRIVWRMKDGERPPGPEWLFEVGARADQEKGAIFLWKVEPERGSNGRQPLR